MAVLELVIAPDPRLKQKSAPVEAITDEIKTLLDNMLDTMYRAGGIGLAAVQVGVHKRLIVADVEQTDDAPGKPLKLINPEIISFSEEKRPYNEGCLSFPGQYAEVIRPASIHLRYTDVEGKDQELKAEGLLATCLQHEVDHMNGVTFVDHISHMKRDMIIRKLQKAKRLGQFDHDHDHHHDHGHGHVHGPHCNH
jgi:peptide deformylase